MYIHLKDANISNFSKANLYRTLFSACGIYMRNRADHIQKNIFTHPNDIFDHKIQIKSFDIYLNGENSQFLNNIFNT